MFKIKNVLMQCSDPNERYFWIVFDDFLTYSRSMIYDKVDKKLYDWILPVSPIIFKNYKERLIGEYIDNSGDKLMLYESDDPIYKWFENDKEKNIKYIEKAIIDAMI